MEYKIIYFVDYLELKVTPTASIFTCCYYLRNRNCFLVFI